MPAVHGKTEYAPVLQSANRIAMIACVHARQEVLAALLDPPHRTLEPHGEQAERDVLRIEDALHAEAAADVRRDHTDAVLGQPEHLGQAVAREVRHLRARPERQLALGGAPVGDAATSFHRRRRVAIGTKRSLDHHHRAVHGQIDAAVLEAAREQDVARRRVVDERRAVAHGGIGLDRRRQRLVVHVDQRRAVLRRVAVGGHDHGQGLAGVARLRPREDRLVGDDVAGQRRLRPQAAAREGVVGARPDVDDARRGGGAPGGDDAKPRVGVNAADEGDVEHAWQLDVADVAPAAGHEAGVLAPGLPGAERRRRHRTGAQSIA